MKTGGRARLGDYDTARNESREYSNVDTCIDHSCTPPPHKQSQLATTTCGYLRHIHLETEHQRTDTAIHRRHAVENAVGTALILV